MNLALRDIRHHRGRFLLTCLGLALLLGVVMSMVGIFRGLESDALTLARAAGTDLWVVEPGRRGPFAETSRIPRDARDTVARLAGVAEAGVITYQVVEAPVDARKVRMFVIGYEPGHPGGPLAVIAGRPIGRSHFEMVIDRRAGIPLGAEIKLGKDVFTVVGHTAGQVDSVGNPVAYLTLKDAQTLQFTLDGAAARNQAARGETANSNQVNAVIARVKPGVSPREVAAGVSRWKHLTALTQAEQEELLLSSLVDKARKQIGLFTILLLIVSAVVIALIVYTMTLDKTREIATLKLIGAPDRAIVGLILQQALAMGVIGFSTGAALVYSVHEHFPRRIVLLVGDDLILAGIVLAVCVLASLAGVRYALRIDPAQALGG
ncbi:MAG: ABC transporter permease [Magnetospirillum sp. WYHS-4]